MRTESQTDRLLTDSQTDRITEADDCYTHATTVGVSNDDGFLDYKLDTRLLRLLSEVSEQYMKWLKIYLQFTMDSDRLLHIKQFCRLRR